MSRYLKSNIYVSKYICSAKCVKFKSEKLKYKICVMIKSRLYI